MTANLPTVPDEVFDAAVTAFYTRRFGFRTADTEFIGQLFDNEVHGGDFRAALAVAFAAGQAAARAGSVQWGVRVDLAHPVRKEKVGDVIKFGGSAAEEMARNAPSIWPGWTTVRRNVPRPSPWLPVAAAGEVA